MDLEEKKWERKKHLVYICVLCLIIIFLALLVLIPTRPLYRRRPPYASFFYSPSTPQVGKTVTFNASASYDPDGIIINYTWSFGDENITSTITPIITHIFTTTGNYTVTLVVKDNDGLTGSTIKVLRVARYPVAYFTYSPDKPLVGESVNLDASASTPNGGYITLYEWDFGDGEKTSTISPFITHVYTRSGTYQVTLSITDSENLQNATSRLIDVMSGAMIDLYTQHPYPYGGQGLDSPSDAFAPQNEVTLSANVTFKGHPMGNTLVTFIVYDPTERLVISETSATSANGIAMTRFTISWQPELSTIFGTWFVYASTEVIGKKVNDSLTFEVGWLVELVKLETCDYAGNVKTRFAHEEQVNFKIYVKNIAMVQKNVFITITMYDELNVPINFTSSSLTVPARSSMIFIFDLKIPEWAFLGNATAHANAFKNGPGGDQIPYCPQISVNFLIIWEEPTPPPPPEAWVVELVKLETCDYAGNVKTTFAKEENIYFKILISNNASVDKNVTLTIVVYDELNVPIGQLTLTGLVVPSRTNMTVTLDLKIPMWAFVGNATAYANAFTDLPSKGGIPYCPQISAPFIIIG